MQWVRADGNPVVETQLEAARTACNQEMQKAAGSQKHPTETDLFRSCMTQRGYIQRVSQ